MSCLDCQAGRSALIIRPMIDADREPILDIIERTGFFTPDELGVALELIDAWLDKPAQKDYIAYSAVQPVPCGIEKPAGYVCFGPTAGAEGAWDMYWLAVDPGLQGRGIGKELVRFCEAYVKERAGRLIIIETSGRDTYASTQGFYIGNGYLVEARIRDFYRPGDDRLIYVKRFTP